MLPVLRSTLVALEHRDRPATSLVRFLFVDEGLLTLVKFARALDDLEPLLCAIGNFELIYGSNSNLNFEEAAREFWRRFGRHSRASDAPHKRDLFGNPVQPFQPRLPFAGMMTTIFFQYPYPPLSRKDFEGSKQSSTSDEGSQSNSNNSKRRG